MPKSKLGINKDNELDKQIRAMIIYKQELNGISTTELAVSAQLSVSTLYERLRSWGWVCKNSTEAFSLKELRRLSTTIHLSLFELLDGEK